MGKNLLIILFMGTLFVSACGNVQNNGDNQGKVKKQIVVEQVVPVTKNDILVKLQELKKFSEDNYLVAEANTRAVEVRGKEKALLKKYRLQVEQEAEAMIAIQKSELEEKYRLKIFNLKMQLESLKLRANNRSLLEDEIEALRLERESKLSLLQLKKKEYIAEKIGEYKLVIQERLNS